MKFSNLLPCVSPFLSSTLEHVFMLQESKCIPQFVILGHVSCNVQTDFLNDLFTHWLLYEYMWRCEWITWWSIRIQRSAGSPRSPCASLGCADHDDGDLQLLKLTCSSLQGLHHPMMTLIWMTGMSKVMCYYLQLLAEDRVLHGFDNEGLWRSWSFITGNKSDSAIKTFEWGSFYAIFLTPSSIRKCILKSLTKPKCNLKGISPGYLWSESFNTKISTKRNVVFFFICLTYQILLFLGYLTTKR